ncbi:SDR family NAD(P)-dependent oxidoreductase [Helcobacillus massiliensis]|uniref:SDR family NAD(P)-dependent oxidoreductase n=1 Tax=Helcobacillus massiliensis TaxID=521392 RepID=A0A839R2J1_9MICO|nr:SDR family NAD(P)-dependent oxidoreductase [Helcobacillus massiliensis]MBB3023126.1 hypothetical protein [Helcobacillus massiliensis]
MHRALITGGTSGIGAAFARAFAQRGADLVIVARNPERLDAFASDIRSRYGVDVETIEADLVHRDDQQRIVERLEADPPIDILVNNAGFSVRSDVLGEDLSLHDDGLEVMVRAVYHLSGAAGRTMAARGEGTIINVTSTSGYVPQNNYSAIKAWAQIYTEALSVRLAGTGVRVVALAPGWVRTEFHERAGINGTSIPGFLWLDPDRLVEECLRDAAAGRVISIPSKRFKLIVALSRLAPRSIIHRMSAWLTARRNKEK